MDGGSTEKINRNSMEDLGCLENLNNPSNSLIIGAIIWSLLLLISVLLNATLLLAFVKRPGLRTISNRFVNFFFCLLIELKEKKHYHHELKN